MRGQTVVKNASDSAFASFLQFLLGSLPVSKKDFLVKSSQLISFGGGLVMVLACGLCFLNIVISGINSIRGSEYPMVFPFSFAKGRVKKATMVILSHLDEMALFAFGIYLWLLLQII